MYNVRKQCLKKPDFSWVGINSTAVSVEDIQSCAQRQVNTVGVSASDVDHCVKYSFKTPMDNSTDNFLLYGDKLLAEVYGIAIHPAITING